MRDAKFRYVLKDRDSEDIVMLSFDLKFIEEWGTEGIYESFEEKYKGECNCLNESCNHCECGTIFDNYKIIARDQYTGRKDKNGVEIYEGDVINIDNSKNYTRSVKGKVVFEYGCFNVVDDKNIYYTFCEMGESIVSIIGKIHDNSELI